MSVQISERTRFPDDDGITFTPDGVLDTDPTMEDLDVQKGVEQLESFLADTAMTNVSVDQSEESLGDYRVGPVYDPHSRELMLMAGVGAYRRRRLISGASQTAMRAAGAAGALGTGRRY